MPKTGKGMSSMNFKYIFFIDKIYMGPKQPHCIRKRDRYNRNVGPGSYGIFLQFNIL